MILVAALLLLELGLFAFAPRVLARLAFIPVALDRRIALDEDVTRALTRELHGGDYRHPPVRTLDEARLDDALGAGLVGFVDAAAGFRRGSVWVRVVRGGRFWVGRPFLVARIRPRLEDGAIALRVRVLPVPIFTIAATLTWMLGPPFDVRGATLVAIVVLSLAVINVLWNRALVRSVVDLAATRLVSTAGASGP